MRLNNREMNLVIDEIYHKINDPRIDSNNNIVAKGIKDYNDEIIEGAIEIQDIAQQIKSLSEKQNKLRNKLYKIAESRNIKNVDRYGYRLPSPENELLSHAANVPYAGSTNPNFNTYLEKYKRYMVTKEQQVPLVDRMDIEKAILFSSNKDLSELIANIVADLGKQ